MASSRSKYVRKLNLAVGISVSLFFIYFAFRNIDPRSILYNISAIRPGWLLPLLIMAVFSMFLRSYRSVYFFSPFGRFSASKMFYIFCAGGLANNVMPFRLGEVARAYISGRILGVSKSTALGVIFLERVFDGVTFLVLLFLVSYFIPAMPDAMKTVVLISGVVFFGLFVSILIWSRNLGRLNALIERAAGSGGLRARLAGIAIKFTHGLSCMTDRKVLARLIFLSFVSWFLEGVNYYLMAKAFSMDINVFQGVFIMLFTGLGIMLPSWPGFVGTYEAACTAAIVILGFGKPLGLSYALFLHFLQIAMVGVLGAMSIMALGIKMGDLSGGALDDEAAVPADVCAGKGVSK